MKPATGRKRPPRLVARFVAISWRDLAVSFGPLVLIAVAAIWVAVRLIQPAFLPVTHSYLISVAYALLIFLSLVRVRLPQVRAVRFLSDTSYSLYLLQYWVMHDLGHRLADGWPTGIRLGIFLLLLPVAAIVSYLSYRYFERPAMRFVRWVFSGDRAQRPVLADGPVGDPPRPSEAGV